MYAGEKHVRITHNEKETNAQVPTTKLNSIIEYIQTEEGHYVYHEFGINFNNLNI